MPRLNIAYLSGNVCLALCEPANVYNVHWLGNRFLSLGDLQESMDLPQGLSHHLLPLPFVSSGCKNLKHGQMLKELMQTPNFRVSVVQEADTVEICGALKVGLVSRAWGSAGLCRELGQEGGWALAQTAASAWDHTGCSWMQPNPELCWEEIPPRCHCFPERGGCRSWFL